MYDIRYIWHRIQEWYKYSLCVEFEILKFKINRLCFWIPRIWSYNDNYSMYNVLNSFYWHIVEIQKKTKNKKLSNIRKAVYKLLTTNYINNYHYNKLEFMFDDLMTGREIDYDYISQISNDGEKLADYLYDLDIDVLAKALKELKIWKY